MPSETSPDFPDITEKPSAKSWCTQIDERSRAFAQQLDQYGDIYRLYNILDPVNLSAGNLKYLWNVLLANSHRSADDALHEWMLTPTGIAVAATESITIITYALLANHFDDDDKNRFKSFIARSYPYLRDLMKGAKNGWKGGKGVIQTANQLGGLDLNYSLLTVGLVLGGASIANRLAYRYMLEARKKMMKINAAILADIEQYETLTAEQCAEFRDQIQAQSMMVRAAGLTSAALGGVLDSAYLYGGVLGLCAFAWPALVAMTVCCVIYSLCCIATRLYEEYDYQRKLLITAAKIELNLFSKEYGIQMQRGFARLQELSLAIAKKPAPEVLKELMVEQQLLSDDLTKKIALFTEKREQLQSLLTLSHLSALLAGMKDALAGYGALTSVLFAASTFVTLITAMLGVTAVAFPPALVITVVSAGLALLVGLITYSLVRNYQHRAEQKLESQQHYERLWDTLQAVNQLKKVTDEPPRVDVKVLLGEKVKAEPPQSYLQVLFEMLRSFFSGLGKGPKSMEFALNPLLEGDSASHYHETPEMMGVSAVAAFVYALVLALRALARGLGRAPIGSGPAHAESSSVSTDCSACSASNGVQDAYSDDAGYVAPLLAAAVNSSNEPGSQSIPSKNSSTTLPQTFLAKEQAIPNLLSDKAGLIEGSKQVWGEPTKLSRPQCPSLSKPDTNIIPYAKSPLGFFTTSREVQSAMSVRQATTVLQEFCRVNPPPAVPIRV